MTLGTRRGLLGLLASGALALLVGRWGAGLYADWLFFEALGHSEIWRTKFITGSAVAVSVFVAVAAFAFANLYAVRQSIISLVLPRQVGDLEVAEAIPTERLTFAAALIACLVAAAFALLPHDWAAALMAWEGLPFGELEPYLERDLGFYVGWMPFERSLQERSTAVAVTVTAMVVVAYALTPSIRWSASGLYVSTWVRRHLAVLCGLLVLLVGWDWRLDRYERLSAATGTLASVGLDAVFSVFDHRIAMPYLGVASFAAMPIAAVLVWAGWKGYLRIVLAMLTVLVVAGPVASALLPLVDRTSLSAAEVRLRERPYVNTVGYFTRRAFGVDEIVGGDSAQVATLVASSLSRSVSAWDPAALDALAGRDARAGILAGTAWRSSPEGLTVLPLRRPAGSGPATLRWRADALLASRADDAGLPFLTGNGSGRVDGVLLHPGAGAFALVADSSGQIAAAGFERGLDRIALAWDLQDPRLLFRELPSPRPTLVTARDIRQRLHRLLPFLAPGQTVTPLLRGDSLYWFVELFATARQYPLSTPVTADGRDLQYARHAGTAIVQAQTGRIQLVATERPDPIMRFWMQRFPGATIPASAAASWVLRERPPAIDQMLVQGSALAKVGFTGDTLGRRRLARPDDADPELAEGAATFFQFDEAGALGWALPVDIPWAGQTLGVLVARGGETRRSEYHAAASPRWTAILETMQAAAAEAGFAGTGRPLRRGRVQTVPTPAGPVWVQSYYDWPSDASPKLAGVVVMRDGVARAGRSLGEALGEPRSAPLLDADAFRERVSRLYDDMQAALRVGDWRAYGDAWAALGRLVGRP